MNRSLLILSIVCLSLFLFPSAGKAPASTSGQPAHLTEAYEPELFYQIQDVQSLISYIDKTYQGNRNSAEFANYIGTVISRRFYHGYSYYSESDNWIASLAGKMIWKDLSAIVVPDDIMKYPIAACSQQSIIMIACARHFGFDVRKVTFDHHFTTEVKVNDKWHYIDPNLEVIPGNESLADLVQQNKLYALYEPKLGKSQVSYVLGHPGYGLPNEKVAGKAQLFQTLTSWISAYFFCILFVIQAFLFFYYMHKENTNGTTGRIAVLKSFIP